MLESTRSFYLLWCDYKKAFRQRQGTLVLSYSAINIEVISVINLTTSAIIKDCYFQWYCDFKSVFNEVSFTLSEDLFLKSNPSMKQYIYLKYL